MYAEIYREMYAEPGRGDVTPMATGTIRYWAGARAAAGTAEEPFSGSTVREVLDQAAARHGERLTRVLAVASFLVDGVRVGPDTVLADGATIEVLPPFAGGSG